MILGLNWMDLVIILGLAYFAFQAIGRPLILELVDLTSFLLSFFLSFKYYSLAANLFEKNFSIPHALSLVFGFTVVWFISEIIFYFLIRSLLNKLPKLKLPGFDFLSFVPAIFRGLIYVALFLVLVATFPIQPSIKKAVQDSKLGSFILQYSYKLEQPVKNVFGDLSTDSLTFLTVKPNVGESINLGFKTSEFKPDEKTEFVMIELVNKERASRNIKTLTFDTKLREVGRAHSSDMFKRGYFSHYSPEGESVAQRAEKFNVDYLIIGENLAYAPNLELAHNGLMNSPGHRANILSTDFNKIGIGVMDGGVYGKMFTQVFSN